MTRTFKVGDRVQLTDRFRDNPPDDVQEGDFAIVHELSEYPGCMLVRFERETINHRKWRSRHGGTWAFHQFKLVSPRVSTFTLDVTFNNVNDAIAAAELLSAHFKRDIPVKVS